MDKQSIVFTANTACTDQLLQEVQGSGVNAYVEDDGEVSVVVLYDIGEAAKFLTHIQDNASLNDLHTAWVVKVVAKLMGIPPEQTDGFTQLLSVAA